MKNWNNIEELKNTKIEVKSTVNVLEVVHAINDAYDGYDAIIGDDDCYLGVPDDAAKIDVSEIKTCGDAIMVLSNILHINASELESQLPITLIDIGGTDEYRYLKMDQIIWTIYSIEELKTIDPTFWINIENLAAPNITGDTKQYKFANRYQTLKSLKDRISSDPIEYALNYNHIISDYLMGQQLKRHHQLMVLADSKISVEAGKYNIHALDRYIAWEMFYLNRNIKYIINATIEQYSGNSKNDIVEFLETKEYSLLEILNIMGVDNCTSIKRNLEYYYKYHIATFISDLERAARERQ